MSAKQRLYASRGAILVLALVSMYFALVRLVGLWAPSGDYAGGFGITIDPATALVTYVYRHNASKGIRIGDRVDLAAMPFSDREYFYEDVSPPPGTAMKVTATRAGARRVATFETVPSAYDYDDTFSAFGEVIVAVAYIFVAVALVWSRPNIMLWGLALFLIRTHTFEFYCGTLRSPPIAVLMLLSFALLHALGWPGLIAFAARFPDNRTTTSTKYWDLAAVAFFLTYSFIDIYNYIPLFTAKPLDDLPSWMSWELSTITACLVLVTLCWKVLRPKARAQWRGFGWVVVGYGVSIVVGWNGANLLFANVQMPSNWPEFGREVLMLALPVSVVYAMIRYRAFGMEYLANRTIVYGVFVVAAGSIILISVWAASRLTSTVAIGLAMSGALLAGMTFRASHALVVRFVDRMFLRRRYEEAQSLDALRDTLRGSNDSKRTIDEVATTLGLSSLAVFSRAADGGFVRDAAFGWPPGSAWHLLPDEALTRSLDDGGTAILRVPDDEDKIAFPLADAKPRFALALRRGNRVERAILVGAQRNGANLDRDAMRLLRAVFDEAIFA